MDKPRYSDPELMCRTLTADLATARQEIERLTTQEESAVRSFFEVQDIRFKLQAENDRLRALLTTAAGALEALCCRFDTFAGEPFENPTSSIWATTRTTLAAIRKEIGT